MVRLSKYKKTELIIQAADILRRRDVKFSLLIVGGGEMYQFLSEEIKRLELGGYVKLLGPIYDESELKFYFKLAKIFVIPTCIGLSAHHAFTYGLPIVTDNSIDSQASEFDILADGLNCVLYEEGNVLSMVEKIEHLLGDIHLQRFLSANAYATVNTVHTISRKAANFLNAIVE